MIFCRTGHEERREECVWRMEGEVIHGGVEGGAERGEQAGGGRLSGSFWKLFRLN